MNLITMVPATARFIAQMRGMRRHIVENNVTEFAVFQNWCDENNERWAEALDSGCAIAIEKFIADWNGRADANRWKHAAQPFKEIDFVFADDGNPRWRHLGFLVSGQAGNPAEKAWERVRRHPLFHAFSALALIEYQCSPAKAALRVARFGKRIYKVT